jgi:predicted ribosome quality control (RQC) complex YloA/Tae2 family protein
MYHTWFFQKRLALALNDRLKGLHLLASFSQQKDELILGFGGPGQQWYIRADMNPQAGLIVVQEDFPRARRNSVDLFPELIDKLVQRVVAYEHERSFFIEFTDHWSLIFKMHGSRSNILLARNNQVLKIFRNNLPGDLQLIPSELDQYSELTEDKIKKLLGRKNQHIDQLGFFREAFLSSPISVGIDHGLPFLTFLVSDQASTITRDPILAANNFAELHYRYGTLVQEKEKALSDIQKQLRQSENYITKTSEKLEEVRNKRNPEELANLIMANLHQIPTGAEHAALDDFYTNTPITIKLNPKLTPQKNAENLYRKSKNKALELKQLEENIRTKKQELEKLIQELQRIQAATSILSLRKAKPEQVNKQPVSLPYHRYEVDKFEILVGKNAKANDQLTLKIAKKEDLWLHARDVSGSHVIVRQKPGKPFPKNVIEHAASLAAWYSKRKTDSLCPVIYTPKKFVRKIKGAPAGQVVVEKEQVMMVEPKNLTV